MIINYWLTSTTDGLDQRRLEVLSKVRGMLTSKIEQYHQQFFDALNNEFPPFSGGSIMVSSLAFGYLKLERDRLLKPQNPGRDVNAPDFLGVSLASVKEFILSMQELNNWKICTVPIADRIPPPLAMLSAFIPVLGVGLHNEGLHMHLQTDFKAKLAQLINSIEEEDWGLDLNQFR